MSESKIIVNVADKTGMYSKAGMFTSKMNSVFARKDHILNHTEPKMIVSNNLTSWVN